MSVVQWKLGTFSHHEPFLGKYIGAKSEVDPKIVPESLITKYRNYPLVCACARSRESVRVFVRAFVLMGAYMLVFVCVCVCVRVCVHALAFVRVSVHVHLFSIYAQMIRMFLLSQAREPASLCECVCACACIYVCM